MTQTERLNITDKHDPLRADDLADHTMAVDQF